MSDGSQVWESPGCGTRDEDKKGTAAFSEHQLLDIMYEACNTSNTGKVLASTIIQYLQTMVSQSTEQDRLTSLQQLLDPECRDSYVSRETFHSTMTEWIAQCSQDGPDEDDNHVSWPASSKTPVNGLDLSGSQGQAASAECHQCACDEKDLSGTVAELKLAHRKLSEQNSSLLRTVAQCEDINLQLTLDSTELRAKLASSAQRSAVRATSLSEELEEAHQMLKEAQERASRSLTSCTKLNNEVECLKVHIRRLEDKNEKLTFEKICSEDNANKLRKVTVELRAELEETLVVMMLRDKENAKKDLLLDRMKSSHVKNHSMIEGLQSELVRLQEHSHQVLLRYDRHCIGPHSLYSLDPPNRRSLQSEMKDMQQHHRALDDISLPALHTRSDDIQSIIHRIKSAEIAHHLQNKYPERPSDPAPPKPLERPSPHRQQQTIKQQLFNVLQELELHECVWEEKEEKEEQRRTWEQKEPKPSRTGGQAQIHEVKKLAVVNWWKARSVEGSKVRSKEVQSEFSETQAKLQKAEQTISDMRAEVLHLQASLKSAQESIIEQKHSSRVIHIDRGTNTEREEPGTTVEKVAKHQRDAAVETEPGGGVASEVDQAQLQVTTDGLLASLRKMEGMVNGALETAELVRESEQRVSQVTVRMESLTQRVEEALNRAADTEEQLNLVEARITEQNPNQPPGLGLTANPGTDAARCRTPDVEPGDGERMDSPPPCPVIPEVTQHPQRLRDAGGTDGDSCSKESPPEPGGQNAKEFFDTTFAAETPFILPYTRSYASRPPTMPTLPEEDEDSPEEVDSSSSSPSTATPAESRAVIMTAPTIIYPQQADIIQQDGRPLEQNRPHSPRSRLARNLPGGPITTVDSTGNMIDLVKDKLPELQLSDEDRQKNLELLEQAKMVSDRFLTRRGRRSTGSLTESPTGLSPTLTPSSSPSSSRSSSLSVAPQSGPTEGAQVSTQLVGQHLEVPAAREHCDTTTQDQEGNRLLVDWKPTEKRKVSSGILTPRFAVQKENHDPAGPKSPPALSKGDEGAGPGRNTNQAPATGVAKPVPRPPTQQAPCTAEIKTIGAFPPLMRAVSWDTVGSHNSRNGAPSFSPPSEDVFEDKPRDIFKSSGYKDLPTQPGGMLKFSKLKEDHKLMRNQSIVGSKLPDLSEAPEQEKGPRTSTSPARSEEAREKSDAMPNISDVMLRKLKLHRGLPGCAPPLTEKEVENAFIQLSLAFRNDNYTLEMRLKQADRERNLTEEDTEKELEAFKAALKMTSPQWQNLEQREAYQRLVETVAVLHRLATRLSSRAEIVGAVRQEKRMNKATEVMMQYVENLKRTYEKDHAELMEFKKLANQNSNRSYGGSVDTGDDGVSRPSRSMSLTLGKALPRRRVSVAVVPKFNLLNIPGQTPPTVGMVPIMGPNTGPALPVLCEANDVKSSAPTEAAPAAAAECGKSVQEQESEPAKPSVNLEEIRAKIEEDAYNKGYQEGLKQSKVLQEVKHEEENPLLESKLKDEESGKKINTNRRMEELLILLGRFSPKISVSRRILWIALTLVVVMCLFISIFNFFTEYYHRHEET
ncbi:inositol 1,4,5-triphosphate receptor associated 1-like [Brachionichthys hirsutus]|uniref:inositol 1,4,5-triphosphate receptor associated 1-like n=1 Tax=Brachionichthys hirsutus TaxID=412623 RepID=UPI003604A7FE